MQGQKLWDIFCRVVDNYGDVGVCWRLCTGLAARGQRVRLWIDDAGPLRWMAPAAAEGVEVRAWPQPSRPADSPAGDILVEAFGCEIAPEFIATYAESTRAEGRKPLWINLEYLSAEPYVERCHRLPSPVLSGPGAGLTKHFFFPGFTPATGGLMREHDLSAQQARFDRQAWLSAMGVPATDEQLIALFCYEPPALSRLLNMLAQGPQRSRLLVTAGRASAAVAQEVSRQISLQPTWNKAGMLSISYLPFLTQGDFDHLLWSCDLNFVRGEDSLVRALWAGKPFVWQIYPQDDGAHRGKLEAFLDMMQAPDSLRQWHRAWNELRQADLMADAKTDEKIEEQAAALPKPDLADWRRATQDLRAQLLSQEDLVTRLLGFASENH